MYIAAFRMPRHVLPGAAILCWLVAALVGLPTSAHADAPPAPTGIEAVVQSNQVTLSWAPSAGATEYHVYVGTSPGGETVDGGTTGTSKTITALPGGAPLYNGTTYYFTVRAYNGLYSPYSTEVSAMPPGAPPTPNSVQALAGSSQITLSWTEPTPADNGIEYHVYVGTSPGGETVYGGTSDTTKTVTGLTNGTTYYYEVRAYDPAYGLYSAYSAEGSATPSASDAVVAPHLTATPGVQQVTLNWNAVASPSGAKTQYQIYKGTSPGGEQALASTSDATYVAGGLDNGTTYYFEIRAMDPTGNEYSPYSNEASATTPTPTPLPAPTNVVAAGDPSQYKIGYINVSWDAVPGAIHYCVYYSKYAGQEMTSQGYKYCQTGTDSDTSASFTGGQADSNHVSDGLPEYFVVVAYNGDYSPPSNEASGSAKTYDTNIPANLTATAYNGEVELSWNSPSNSTNYVDVFMGTSPGKESPNMVAHTVHGNDTVVVGGLTNGTQYYFEARYTSGEPDYGPPSNEVSSTPTSTAPHKDLQAAPVITAASGVNSVTLSWNAVTTASGFTTQYYIYQGSRSHGETLLTSTSKTSFTSDGLESGTTYYYEVKAYDSGDGQYSAVSNEVSATTTP